MSEQQMRHGTFMHALRTDCRTEPSSSMSRSRRCTVIVVTSGSLMPADREAQRDRTKQRKRIVDGAGHPDRQRYDSCQVDSTLMGINLPLVTNVSHSKRRLSRYLLATTFCRPSTSLWQHESLTIQSKFSSGNQAMFTYDVMFEQPIGAVGTANLMTFGGEKIKEIELFYDPRPLVETPVASKE
jgi:hypothetical protein